MGKIRLDKYIADACLLPRKDATTAIRRGRVTVNDKLIRDAAYKTDETADTVTLDGETVRYRANLYYMLNKPAGYLCASEDKSGMTVLTLFPEEAVNKGIACVGRLDKDTTGLLLVTNDGALAHRLLSPKSGTKKVYAVECDKPFAAADIETMHRGIIIEGKNTAPAELVIDEDNPHRAAVTLTEGKFHEVKRLCYACGEKEVINLHRLTFGALKLDESLEEGQYRFLSDEEIAALNEM